MTLNGTTLSRQIERARQATELAQAYSSVLQFPRHATLQMHNLPGELIVSLTSYPPRFGVLHYTLKSLLDQTIKPDRIILWLAEGDYSSLPRSVSALSKHGLEIRRCDDLRSYKKLVPTLELFPLSFIVTADDDLYYESNWFHTIVDGYDPSRPSIVCRRAHQPVRRPNRKLSAYSDWKWEIVMERNAQPSPDLFPTGVGGVLYFPGALASQVTDRNAIRKLCPFSDDIWFYWMSRIAGTHYSQVGGPFRQVPWFRSQTVSLCSVNVAAGENDRQIRAMESAFGLTYPDYAASPEQCSSNRS